MFGLGLGNVKNYGIKSIGTAAGKGVLEGVTGRKNPTWGSVLGIDTSRILQNPAKVVNEVVRDVISGKKSIADIPSMMFGSFDTVQHRLNSLSNPDNWVDLLTGKNTKLTTSNPAGTNFEISAILCSLFDAKTSFILFLCIVFICITTPHRR